MASEMVLFEQGETPIRLHAGNDEDAVFIVGSTVPHPYPLHLGYYSVHTSTERLKAGERRIAELGHRLEKAGERQPATRTVPVFR